MAESFLQALVLSKCRELDVEAAAGFFDVSPGLVRQWLAGSKTPSLAAVEKVFTQPETAPTEAGWTGRDVFIAMPFYKTTSPRTLFSLLSVWDRPKFRAGMEFDNALLIDAREKLADDYLATGAPWCWWHDSDMICPCGSAGWFNRYAEMQLPERFAGVHTPTQLRSHGKSVVSAVYVERRNKGRAVFDEALTNPEVNRRAHQAPFEGLEATNWAGLGCLMHNRQVLLDIKAKNPHLAPEGPGEYFHFFSPSPDALIRALPSLRSKVEAAAEQIRGGTHEAALKLLLDFTAQIESVQKESKWQSRLRQGEDRTFGLRAKDAGHQTWIDYSVVCSHIGEKAYNTQNTGS